MDQQKQQTYQFEEKTAAPIEEKPIKEEKANTAESQTITVDLKGAVKNEGVYQIEKGNRLFDLIQKAGGLTPEADKKSINLASKLADEQLIYVAKVGEEVVSNVTNNHQESSSSTTIVNINKANLEELQTITGIGQKKAQEIINYREKNGLFKSIEDLKNISGIGEKSIEKIKDEISID